MDAMFRLSPFALKATTGLFCLVVAACGAVPQPFRPADRDIGTWDQAAPGVTVLPVRGLLPPLDEETSTQIAEELIEAGVLAEAMPYNAGLGYTLTGYLDGAEPVTQGRRVALTWEFRQRESGVIDRRDAEILVPEAAWQSQDAVLAQVLSAAPVDMVAGFLAPRVARPDAIEEAPAELRVAVLPVVGAPDAGRAPLARALRTQLALQGFRPSESAADIVIATEWQDEPAGPGQTYILITWTVTDGRTGAELGQQSLDNTIPADALDGLWGPLSLAIVSAGVPGLLEIIESRPEE